MQKWITFPQVKELLHLSLTATVDWAIKQFDLKNYKVINHDNYFQAMFLESEILEKTALLNLTKIKRKRRTKLEMRKAREITQNKPELDHAWVSFVEAKRLAGVHKCYSKKNFVSMLNISPFYLRDVSDVGSTMPRWEFNRLALIDAIRNYKPKNPNCSANLKPDKEVFQVTSELPKEEKWISFLEAKNRLQVSKFWNFLRFREEFSELTYRRNGECNYGYDRYEFLESDVSREVAKRAVTRLDLPVNPNWIRIGDVRRRLKLNSFTNLESVKMQFPTLVSRKTTYSPYVSEIRETELLEIEREMKETSRPTQPLLPECDPCDEPFGPVPIDTKVDHNLTVLMQRIEGMNNKLNHVVDTVAKIYATVMVPSNELKKDMLKLRQILENHNNYVMGSLKMKRKDRT